MKTDRKPVVMSNGSVWNTLYPKENVFGETLQNCFFVGCLFRFVVVILRFGCFCHFGLSGVSFCKVGWGGEGCDFAFFVSRGLETKCAILVCYFIFLPIE